MGVRRELANDIQCKTHYEKKLSGFAYIDEGECRFFTDAFLQTTYETKQKYEMAGKIVTPIYERHYWLNDMSELKTVKRDFDEHLKACFDESFWQVYGRNFRSARCAGYGNLRKRSRESTRAVLRLSLCQFHALRLALD